MKRLYLTVIIITLLVTLTGLCAFAQSPNDGAVGVKGGGKSTGITSLSSQLLFSPCQGATGDVAFDCKLFGGAQEIFAGINETGFAWNTLAISLKGYNPTTDPTVSCSGFIGTDNVFQHCATSVSGSTLTITLKQGDGSGIGCDISVNNCLGNSLSALLQDLSGKSPVEPWDSVNPFCELPGAVCGSDEFVIGVGYDGFPFNTPLSAHGSLGANGVKPPSITPEPQTFVMVGGAVLGLLALALKKGLLA
jgi:hypothetical protein